MPWVLLRLAWRGFKNPAYWDRWPERFGFTQSLGPREQAKLWVHAVSVGEAQVAVPLVRALQERYPGIRILVTTMTPTGAERVKHTLGDSVEHRYVPYDLPGSVSRFLDNVRPSLAIIIETELWPNILRLCRKRMIPVLLTNVRLSERSAAGYRRFAGSVREMLSKVSAIAAQSRDDANRLVLLGAEPEKIRVTGSVKFDIRLRASVKEEGQVIRRQWGVDRGVWIAASTHEGEEEQILDAFAGVLNRISDCLLVLVPRHPERFAKAAALCRKRGYSTLLRSEMPESCVNADVFIGDTMGELPTFYAASDLAFVGGSLVETGGHNMLEPAALGLPVVVGPHVFNFAEISRRLCDVGAARQVHNAKELEEVVVSFLQDANLRHYTGEKGKSFVRENRGALDSVLEMVEGYLPPQSV